MFHSDWGGLPSVAFLSGLSSGLARLRSSLYDEVFASDTVAGCLDAEIAEKCGLQAGTPIAVGGFDAHFGAVGSGVKSGRLVKIIGTSTCDIMVAPMDGTVRDIPGICGVAEHSVLPGMLGLEAGQSAVGDIFNWFVQQICGDPDGVTTHARLSSEAARLAAGESGLLALDWNNGNRSILTDPRLTGLLLGQTLATSPCEIYRALIEATAFGALRIIERLEEYGVKIEEIVACGGIAEKSPLLMQIYADVCNRPMQVSASPQTCALGAAIFGAVAGGAHQTVESAQNAMVRKPETRYEPNHESNAVYSQLYPLYRRLHDAFGVPGTQPDLSATMKRLLEIREMSRR
jgi:L-ribulokinase